MKKHLDYRRTKKSSARQKLRFITIFGGVILCLILLNSCYRKQTDPLLYRSKPLRAGISSIGFGVDFKADVTALPPSDNREREIIFDLTAPPSLNGLRVRIKGGRAEISLNGQMLSNSNLPSNAALGLGRAFEMLSAEGSVSEIKSVSGGECGCPNFEALTAVSTASFVIYIDPTSGTPVKIADKKSGAFLIVESVTFQE